MPWNQEGKPIKMQPVQVNIPINHYHSSNIKKQDGLILLLQILKTKLAKTAYFLRGSAYKCICPVASHCLQSTWKKLGINLIMSFLKSGFLIGKSSVLLPMHEDHGVLFFGELLSSIFICAHILQHNMPWRSLDKLL